MRLGTGTALTVPSGVFNGTREFKVTAGTFQVDAADASSVNVTGVNQLSVDRTNNSSVDPAPRHAHARRRLVPDRIDRQHDDGHPRRGCSPPAAPRSCRVDRHRGEQRHGRRLGGPLTVSAAALKGNGAWDPNGQSLTFTGNVQDIAPGNPTTLRIAGGNGGTAFLNLASTHSGGTVIDGMPAQSPSRSASPPPARWATGPVTLNGGLLQINTDASLNFSANSVNVIGSATSGINYEHIAGNNGRTQTLGALTLGGQTLNLIGPPTSAYSYTLAIGGTTVSPAARPSSAPADRPHRFAGRAHAQRRPQPLAHQREFQRRRPLGNRLDHPLITHRHADLQQVGYQLHRQPLHLGRHDQLPRRRRAGHRHLHLCGWKHQSPGERALSGTTGNFFGGSLNLNANKALDGTTVQATGGNIFTSTAGSLGTGTVQLNGAKLFLRNDAGAVFNGTINVTGIPGSGNAGSITVDRSSAAGTGGTQTISALSVADQSLSLVAPNAGYGLAVSGPTTISGVSGGTIDNRATQLTLASLAINSPFNLTGTGNTTIGPLGGNATANFSTTGTVTFTSAPQAGFASSVVLNTGIANVNSAASFAGGSVRVNGGVLNLGVSNALSNTQATLQSGFINANAPLALNGVSLAITNGTLLANANNALGNAPST